MNRTVAYALGPECMWVLALAAVAGLAARNHPPTEALSKQLETVGLILPATTVLLSFAPFAWTPGSRWWLLLRIFVAGLVGLGVVSWRICNGIDYQDSRNSGLFAAWVMFVGAGFLPLVVGEITVAFFLLTKWRALPFLKWGFIILAALGLLWGIICWLASLDQSKSSPAKDASLNRPPGQP